MIDTIEIDRFRGISHGKVEGLSRVNLFFGQNNCGKSTLLEALFLVCGQSNPLLPASINAMRTYNRMTEQDIRYFFYQMNDKDGIDIYTSGSQNRHLTITSVSEAAPIESGSISTEIPYRYGLRMRFDTKDGEASSEVMYDLGKENQTELKTNVDKHYSEQLKCLYLSPRYDSNASIEGLQNIYMNKDEAFLSEALRVIEPKAKNPLFMDNVMYVDIGLPKRIPINLMGDGIRKIVSFLTSIYECRGGVVLIDELSNGFHYSVMKPMWDIVIRAAVKNDVQIFATTHDVDSIKGFQKAASGVKDNDGNDIATSFKLQRISDDELRAYRFNIEQLGFAIEQEMEVR